LAQSIVVGIASPLHHSVAHRRPCGLAMGA
jgi:hypothetical protein